MIRKQSILSIVCFCVFVVVSGAVLGLIAGCAGVNSTTTVSTTVAPTVTTVPNLTPYADASGSISSYSLAGLINESGPFFASLGSNKRTCANCHELNQGMGLSSGSAAALYTSSAGLDALFAPIDGANCPSVAANDANGHSLIVYSGLIRIAMALPTGAQFSVSVVSDPYGCAQTTSTAGASAISLYRRPLPTTNQTFLSSVMWDTRETVDPLTSEGTFLTNLDSDLSSQTIQAVLNHAQATGAPSTGDVNAIVSFMTALYTAQATDGAAGSLTAGGATGGALALSEQKYYPGINDAFGGDPTGAKFNPAVFNLYTAWANSQNPSEASIARGEQIFNTAPINITGVRGINDNPALGSPAQLRGSCATCHDTPNVGSHSLPLVMDTGIGHVAARETDGGVLAGLGQLTIPTLPTYEITGCKDAAGNAVTFYTTDPGKGMVSGLCADVNRVKVPGLRGMAARAPFFHNGSAASLTQVVNFYNARFKMGLNAGQKTDLVNFLGAL